MCCILNLPKNNNDYEGRFFQVKVEDPLRIDNTWSETVDNLKQPWLTSIDSPMVLGKQSIQ